MKNAEVVKKRGLSSRERGITLVALVVTIIVLLILAGIAIGMLFGDDGIIDSTKRATEETKISQEIEELKTEIMEKGIKEQAEKTTETLEEYLREEGYTVENKDGYIFVTMSSGNKYSITPDETIELIETASTNKNTKLTLDKQTITKEIESGNEETETLVATLKHGKGNLTWESNNEEVVSISGEGNTRTLTLKQAGIATITVSFGEISTSCEVRVTENIGTSTVADHLGEDIYYDCFTGVDESLLTCSALSSQTGYDYNQVYTLTEDNTKDLKWMILGTDGDNILITTTQPVFTNKKFYLKGKKGYQYGPTALNNVCEIFGHGTNAKKARSMENSDLYKIANFTPTVQKSHRYEKVDYISNGWTYYEIRVDGQLPQSNPKKSKCTYFDESKEEWIELPLDNKVVITPNSYSYSYSLYSLKGLKLVDRLVYKEGSDSDYCDTYWLATRAVSCITSADSISYSISYKDYFRHYEDTMFYSYGTEGRSCRALRPVVTLNSDVKLTTRDVDGVWRVTTE